MNFIAIDVETANSDMSSICSIGMVQFRDGVVEKNLSTLIDPEAKFDGINISIHNITPEMVRGAPTMRYLYPFFLKNFCDVIVVHHTHFDRVAFRKVGENLGLPEIQCKWLDSARVTRRTWADCSKRGYGLAEMSARLGIEFTHHQASEDARCAGLILLAAIRESGISIEQWFARVESPIVSDQKLARPANPEGALFGEVVAFTGKLLIDRLKAAELAAQAGCKVGSGVTRDTTILVCGDQDDRVLKGKTHSAKLQKAMDLIADGHRLRVIREADFMTLVS